MKKNNKQRGWKIDRERAEQISNNVSEEYIDQGLTNFATKKELCETIIFLMRIHDYQYQYLQGALTGIMTDAAQSLTDIHETVNENLERDTKQEKETKKFINNLKKDLND